MKIEKITTNYPNVVTEEYLVTITLCVPEADAAYLKRASARRDQSINDPRNLKSDLSYLIRDALANYSETGFAKIREAIIENTPTDELINLLSQAVQRRMDIQPA